MWRVEAELLKVEENCAIEELRVDDLGQRDQKREHMGMAQKTYIWYRVSSTYTLYIIVKPLELDKEYLAMMGGY